MFPQSHRGAGLRARQRETESPVARAYQSRSRMPAIRFRRGESHSREKASKDAI